MNFSLGGKDILTMPKVNTTRFGLFKVLVLSGPQVLDSYQTQLERQLIIRFVGTFYKTSQYSDKLASCEYILASLYCK